MILFFRYSGNNENMDTGQGNENDLVDYTALYTNTVQRSFRATDRSHLYWQASPSNGMILEDADRDLFITRWGSSQVR